MADEKTENRAELGMIDTKVLEQIQDQARAIEDNDKAAGTIRQLAFLFGRFVRLIADIDVRLAKLESARRYPQP